ncbi:protein CHUP1, chloroplastic [Silene latifolia]|uniref:protein CHUP1, chloroplastic n=1 Tax=Silene latifolia TaxID=37657 RepID=UPI003D77003A
MCSSESRAEVMKPFLVKASISTALSITAYICARFISKRSNSTKDSLSTIIDQSRQDCESFHSLSSASLDDVERKYEDNIEDIRNGYISNLEHKLLDMESRYLGYRALKEKEFMLIGIKNEMLLEKTRAEFLLKEIYLAEEENKKIGNLVINFIRLFENFQGLKKENVLLQRKVRKLWRKAEHRLTIVWQQKLLIKGKDEELMNNKEEIEKREFIIQEIENENKELKEVIDHLQREKIELLNKVDLVEKSYASEIKIEVTEIVSKEEYDKVLKELEQLQKDKETEANEITYLKWSNACLRHELVRCHEQNENRVVEFEYHDHEDEKNNVITSKRRRFIKKIKKWVDGGEDDENKGKEIKCFGKHSVHEEAEELFVHARNSCSSV